MSPEQIRAGMPTERANAINKTVCSVQSPEREPNVVSEEL